MNVESARLAELMPAIGGLIQPAAAIQKWQAELSATPLWLLQTLLGVVSIAVCAVFLIGRSRFGRKFWQVLKPCMGRHGALRTLAVSLLMIVLLLTESDCMCSIRFEQQRVQRDAGQAGRRILEGGID